MSEGTVFVGLPYERYFLQQFNTVRKALVSFRLGLRQLLPEQQAVHTGFMVDNAQSADASASQPAPLITDSQAEVPLAKAPRELVPWQAWLTALCIPFFLLMFTCSMLGLYVLTGKSHICGAQ